MCKAEQASIAYFYFDFRDAHKQNSHDLVSSLLSQLSAGSAPRCDILSRLYLAHDTGNKQPSDSILAECLKQMFTLPDQRPVYLIMDAVDECPNSSGIPTPREQVLQLIQELVELHLPHLHICRLTYEMSLIPLLLSRFPFMTKLDKRKILPTILGRSSTQIRDQS